MDVDLAMKPVPGEESALDSFAHRHFDILGYTTRDIAFRYTFGAAEIRRHD